jgi:hypothetical protein
VGKSILKLVFGCLIALSICVPSFAAKKLFPANHGSVTLENFYADAVGLHRFSSLAEVSRAAEMGILVPVPITVAPKLPSVRRYVRPAAAAFMLELDVRFYLTTKHFLIVDSAVRPEEVQRRLARCSRNAAPATGVRASSHERGTTFDLAKRTFGNTGVSRLRKSEYRLLLMWLAYYQATGHIHVIEERACLHIMVREDYEGSQQVVSVAGLESLVPDDAPVPLSGPDVPVQSGQPVASALPEGR